jgi:predicted 3-demethylubiquinone-9 3-methyltransferase (glyoxalase superfamily)
MSKLDKTKTNGQKITPHLWFEDNAEEAARFYTSVFKNSKVTDITHYGESAAEVSGRPKGTVMTVTFEIEGQQFIALNGGPVFKFSPAISFLVSCETQKK